jgi:hypothetical protein
MKKKIIYYYIIIKNLKRINNKKKINYLHNIFPNINIMII